MMYSLLFYNSRPQKYKRQSNRTAFLFGPPSPGGQWVGIYVEGIAALVVIGGLKTGYRALERRGLLSSFSFLLAILVFLLTLQLNLFQLLLLIRCHQGLHFCLLLVMNGFLPFPVFFHRYLVILLQFIHLFFCFFTDGFHLGLLFVCELHFFGHLFFMMFMMSLTRLTFLGLRLCGYS